MNPISSLLGISRIIGDHLWQSTIVAIVAALLTWIVRRNRAQVRYWIWFAALMKFLVPFAAFAFVGERLSSWALPESPLPPSLPFAIQVASQPFSSGPVRTIAGGATSAGASGALSGALLAIWLFGLAVILVTWWVRWRRVAAMVRKATPVASGRLLDALRRVERRMNSQQPVSLVVSNGLLEPGVFGILSPVFFWPNGLSDRLDDEQIESIIAHELAHVARRDNLTALLYLLVQAVFWFYPVVWFLGARLVHERERSCDESVLRLGTDPRAYAASLLATCKLFVESPLTCVAGVTGSDLKKRIEIIMSDPSRETFDRWRKLLVLTAGTVTLAVPTVVGVLNAPRVGAQSVAVAGSAGPSFEVASVKPNKTASRPGGLGSSLERLGVTALPLRALIRYAYEIQDDQLAGGPAWINADAFDIDAKVGRPTDGSARIAPETLRLMMRTLLADRFKLVMHNEVRELPVYALVLARRNRTLGPQLRKGRIDCLALEKRGEPPPPEAEKECGGQLNPGRLILNGFPISLVAENLSTWAGRMVLDRTGLEGPYNLELHWSVDHRPQFDAIGASAAHYNIAPDPSLPSLFTAVEEQLGLKLDSQRAAINVLVIDRVEQPTPN
jgi:bla regulator protein blaR1